MPSRAVITLTTDFGYDDPFAGVMKGVMLGINPDVEIVDITHGIKPHDIREAAYTIGMNYRFFPPNTIHIVVVDPGVGSGRRPVIVSAERHYFIGPDNGVFSYIYGMQPESLSVCHITAEHYFLSADSPTFQARDVFAPIAAWFSRGISLSKFGDPVNDYISIALAIPDLSDAGMIRGEVIHIDRFGNAITNITASELGQLSSSSADSSLRIMLRDLSVPLRKYYEQADKGSLAALMNSSGFLEFFMYEGNAALTHAIATGDSVTVSKL
ncbi:MAG: hypothetical protein EPN25_04700 [Nitrospirae bacterium]|nr:MAG: hypothetical protein EPN25_04700 [Nitrospirota bacterium]